MLGLPKKSFQSFRFLHRLFRVWVCIEIIRIHEFPQHIYVKENTETKIKTNCQAAGKSRNHLWRKVGPCVEAGKMFARLRRWGRGAGRQDTW